MVVVLSFSDCYSSVTTPRLSSTAVAFETSLRQNLWALAVAFLMQVKVSIDGTFRPVADLPEVAPGSPA